MMGFLTFLSPKAWIAVGVAALLALIAVQSLRLAQAKSDLRIARDRAEAAETLVAAQKQAADVVAAQGASEAAVDRTTTENRDTILTAPGASIAVDPGVDAAGRRALCLRKSLRCTAGCVKLLGACPK